MACPWSTRAKDKRLWEIEKLRETLPEDEVLAYEDQVDIHLNPRIGTGAGQRFALHLLPRQCPDHNKIEFAWQDLDANVSRNHRFSTMAELVNNTGHYLRTRNKKAETEYQLAS